MNGRPRLIPTQASPDARALGALLAVVVNYRCAGLTLDCVRSLMADLARSARPARVTVVDNASDDGSVEIIRAGVEAAGWGGSIEVIDAGRNAGFAAGNNAAIRLAMGAADPPEFVWLLNPDTLVKPGATEALAGFLEQRAEVGICGSSLEDASGRRVSAAHRMLSPLTELESGARLGLFSALIGKNMALTERPYRCGWVSGASLMARREVFETVGLMDEEFFLYYEEVDFCQRARAHGWQVWHVPASRIAHFEGSTTGVNAAGRRRPEYWYSSRRRFFRKHYGVGGLLAADALWALGHASLKARRALRLGGSDQGLPQRAMRDLLGGDARALLRGGAGTTGGARA